MIPQQARGQLFRNLFLDYFLGDRRLVFSTYQENNVTGFHQCCYSKCEPVGQVLLTFEIFLPNHLCGLSYLRNMSMCVSGSAGLIHSNMTVHTQAHYCYINATVLKDIIVHPFTLLFLLTRSSIKKTNSALGYMQRIKQLKIQMIPAATFLISVHIHPFVQSHKMPIGNVHFISSYSFRNFFV